MSCSICYSFLKVSYFVQHFLFFCKSNLSSHFRHLFLPCSNVIPILFTSALVIQWLASTFSCASLSCHVPASWHRTNNPAFRLSQEENLRRIGFSIKLDGQFTLIVCFLSVTLKIWTNCQSLQVLYCESDTSDQRCHTTMRNRRLLLPCLF